jgi:hypothetical protein
MGPSLMTLSGSKSVSLSQSSVEVLEENRTLNTQNGVFRDDFQPWDAHVYRIAAAPGR